MKFMQTLGKIELPRKETTGGNCMNYQHLSMEERSCIRKYYVDGMSHRQLLNLPKKCQYGIARNSAELYPYVRHSNLLPTHSPEEVPAGNLKEPP